MHILIENCDREQIIVKKSNIGRVYNGMRGRTCISFTNPKSNPAIFTHLTVEEVFDILAKK